MVELIFSGIFDMVKTFECGQIFRFETIDFGKTYFGALHDRIIKITQKDPHTLIFSSNINSNLEKLLKIFFRTHDNYLDMQKSIKIDNLMKKVVDFSNGLHLLNQDNFECSISYILSQCSNIPRIKRNLKDLGKLYGKQVMFEDKEFFLFPTRSDLITVTEEEFRDLGFGYRAKYLRNFIKNYPSFFNEPVLDSEIFNQKLQNIEGIGQKVADCIQLFAYGDISHFPVDTWMEKFMIKFYNNGEKISKKKIRELGGTLFGKWAGYAQEFIFYYARNHPQFFPSKKKKKKI
ncbi:DNA-3-methyladenine glycosylase [Promethearchaeum syntrophicum]|uniref:DNA-(apurinic or apyrimidinic site) lyase n=1 Tax=Promethearchaeum syntrophicum TaxID=2594042 RepID=A0A5B9DBV7_9ARCH